ncbi:unnamed protein product, partial [Effrenium voratum]
EWSLHLLNKAYCSGCRRHGSWDRLNLCLHDFVSLFPRTFELFGPHSQLVRPLRSSASSVADGEEEVMKRLALAKQRGVVHAQTPIEGAAGGASTRLIQATPDIQHSCAKACYVPSRSESRRSSARTSYASRPTTAGTSRPSRPTSRPTSASRWRPSRPTSASVSRPTSASYASYASRPTSASIPVRRPVQGQAAAALRDVGDSTGEAFALLNEVASAYLARKEVDSALKVAAAGLRLLRAAEDLPGELVALKATAQIHLCRGDTEPTLRLLQEVISLSKDSGDAADETDAHVAVARVRVLRSEAEEALAAARAALGAAKTPLSEAKARLGLARVLEAKAADPRAAEASKAEAAQAAQQAAKLFASARYSAGQLAALKVAWALGAASAKEAADAFRGAGDLQSCGEALLEAADGAAKDVENAQKALEIFRELNHTKLEAKALHKLSAAERARGQQSASIKAAVDVVALFQRRGDVKGQAEATCELAKVYMALGMLKDALSEVGEARLLFQKLKQVQLQEARVLLDVAIPAHMALNEAPKAVAVAEDAANICRSLGDKVGEADAFKACAKVCVQQGDTKSALQASRQAAAVLSRARLVKEEAEAYHLTANVHIIRLEPREAVSSAAQALSLLRRPGDEGDRADALITASYGHSMALEADGALGSAEEAVGLARRTCSTSRLKKALHALAEAQLLKGQYGEAMDTAEEALQVQNGDALLEAHLAGVSCYGRLGWSQSKKKGLRANPKEMLQKAKAASTALLASGNRRFEADARFLMAKVQLQAGNVDVAINEVLKAYNDYGTLKDGQGAGWSGLLYAACLLRAPAKMAGGYSALTCQDVEVPQYEAALHTALVAHSTFRRIGDEEGTEAALRAVGEIRAKKEGRAFATGFLYAPLSAGDAIPCPVLGLRARPLVV